MWLILSRKGFDSESGGLPSPIFPDGAMFSLPIPSGDRERLEDLRHGEVDIASVVTGIANRRMSGRDRVHLDPDLDFNAYPYRRDRNALQRRRGMPGQAGAAQSHLNNHGVDGSDLFRFFGLYRRVEEATQGWRFVRGTPNLHILWGWSELTRNIGSLTSGQITSLGHAIIPTSMKATAATGILRTRRLCIWT